jgi:hypothetical protein
MVVSVTPERRLEVVDFSLALDENPSRTPEDMVPQLRGGCGMQGLCP